jgi:hypothetical protein
MQSGENCLVSESPLKVVKALRTQISTSLPDKTNRVRKAEREGVSRAV